VRQVQTGTCNVVEELEGLERVGPLGLPPDQVEHVIEGLGAIQVVALRPVAV
jgi:hypothetical protein